MNLITSQLKWKTALQKLFFAFVHMGNHVVTYSAKNRESFAEILIKGQEYGDNTSLFLCLLLRLEALDLVNQIVFIVLDKDLVSNT